MLGLGLRLGPRVGLGLGLRLWLRLRLRLRLGLGLGPVPPLPDFPAPPSLAACVAPGQAVSWATGPEKRAAGLGFLLVGAGTSSWGPHCTEGETEVRRGVKCRVLGHPGWPLWCELWHSRC